MIEILLNKIKKQYWKAILINYILGWLLLCQDIVTQSNKSTKKFHIFNKNEVSIWYHTCHCISGNQTFNLCETFKFSNFFQQNSNLQFPPPKQRKILSQ